MELGLTVRCVKPINASVIIRKNFRGCCGGTGCCRGTCAVKAVTFARDIGLSSITVEGDSEIIINSLKWPRNSCCLWSFDWRDKSHCKFLCNFSYVCNFTAHHIARYVSSFSMWMENIPSHLNAALSRFGYSLVIKLQSSSKKRSEAYAHELKELGLKSMIGLEIYLAPDSSSPCERRCLEAHLLCLHWVHAITPNQCLSFKNIIL